MIQTRAKLDKGQFNKRQNQVGDSWKRVPNTRDVFVWYTFLKVSIYTSLRVPGAFGLQKISMLKILVRRIPGVCLIRL